MEDEDPKQYDSCRCGAKIESAKASRPRRQRANDRMVDTIRTYGIIVIAALVLLPPQLVAVGLAVVAFVYAWMKYVWWPLVTKQEAAA